MVCAVKITVAKAVVAVYDLVIAFSSNLITTKVVRPVLTRISARILCAAAPRATGTNVEGKKFLQDKAEEPGVVTLPSGLMYKVLTEGDGDSHPTADSSCSCHYAGTLTDGSEFDSSYGRGEPTDFAPNQVIPGWTEAMQLMKEGDKWELTIPSEIAYGDRQMGADITPGAVLIFTLEILKVGV